MKEIRKTVTLIKQFFVFSRTEQKGIFGLVVLMVLVALAPWFYRLVYPPNVLDFKITDLGTIEPQTDETLSTYATTSDTNSVAVKSTPQLFYFNPNSADSITLTELGFSPKVVRGMLNYRLKGGQFKKADDLFKIYGVDSTLIRQLIPYVRIDNTTFDKTPTKTFLEQQASKKQIVVDVNTADSSQLVALYGIGPKMASKIIDYRQRLGGFFTLTQLLEIYGIDEDVLQELEGKIIVDVTKVRYLPINTVTLEELKRNPYIKSRLANAIINYRLQHGNFKRVDDLKHIVIMHDSTYNKLLPYLKLN
ncbi:MAG: hypothetical protein EAY81_03560 [Bacteroidetes bacterium]|nr:MAG: hypothetical protein EAY81_03560 [Bacteroidota bacterium]